jgi:hypothetical protein
MELWDDKEGYQGVRMATQFSLKDGKPCLQMR